MSELDAGGNRTRLQAGEIRIFTPYLPGRASGDRSGFDSARTGDRRAVNGAGEQQQLALPLTDVIEMPDQVRLVFPGALSAYVSRALYEKGRVHAAGRSSFLRTPSGFSRNRGRRIPEPRGGHKSRARRRRPLNSADSPPHSSAPR